MRLARKISDLLTNLSAFLGGAALFVGLAVIMIDVIGRMMGSPLRGSPDLVQMAFVIVVFGGIPYCTKIGGHVAVDLFENSFPEALNRAFVIFGQLAGAVIFALIAWQMWASSKLSVMLNLSTNILFLPKAPFQYAVVVLSLITCLGLIVRSIDLMRGAPLTHSDPAKGEF